MWGQWWYWKVVVVAKTKGGAATLLFPLLAGTYLKVRERVFLLLFE